MDVRAALYYLPDELKAGETARPDRRGLARVAGIWPSDPGERVERREPCPPIVGIGAGVDQRDRELEVTVLHREQQRARTLADRPLQGGVSVRTVAALSRCRHVDARRQKLAHDVQVPRAHGKEERCESGIERRVDVGARVDQ